MTHTQRLSAYESIDTFQADDLLAPGEMAKKWSRITLNDRFGSDKIGTEIKEGLKTLRFQI